MAGIGPEGSDFRFQISDFRSQSSSSTSRNYRFQRSKSSHILHSRRFRNVKASTWKISANQAKPWILHSRFQISDFRAPCAPSQQGRKQKAECRFQIARNLQWLWETTNFKFQISQSNGPRWARVVSRFRFQNAECKSQTDLRAAQKPSREISEYRFQSA